MMKTRDSQALAAPLQAQHRGCSAPHCSVCTEYTEYRARRRVVVVIVVLVVRRQHSSHAARPRHARGPARSKRVSPLRRRSCGSSPRSPLAAAVPHPPNRSIRGDSSGCSRAPAWIPPTLFPPPPLPQRVSYRCRASSLSRSTSCGSTTPGIPNCSKSRRRVASVRPRYSTSSEDVASSLQGRRDHAGGESRPRRDLKARGLLGMYQADASYEVLPRCVGLVALFIRGIRRARTRARAGRYG